MLSARIIFEKELNVKAFICGIQIYPRAARIKKQSCPQGHSGSEGQEDTRAGNDREKAGKWGNCKTGRSLKFTEPVTPLEPAGDSKEKADALEEADRETFGTEGRTKQKEFSAGNMTDRLKRLVQKLQDSLRDIRSTLRGLYERLSYYKSIWDREETQRAFRLASAQLSKTMPSHVLPRRTDVYAVIGTGDPASTGQILAVQGMLYPWLGEEITSYRILKKSTLKEDFILRGHIRAGVLGFYVLRLMFDRDVRHFIGILRGRTADKGGEQWQKTKTIILLL